MDQAEPIVERPALTFHATRASFAKLLVINSLLTLVTLGTYRFWAKTNIRRYFWRNVSFLDDPLEYTGTGGELFVGFLIVIAVLFPLGLVYGAIDALVPADKPWLRLTLEATYYIVLFALLQIGFYRMWRYRMSRTTWRGVRFGLDGSTWAYLRLAAGWTVLSVLTLGAAYPWMQVDLWRYQIRHTRLGDQAFRFEGHARTLFAAWLVPFATILANVAVAIWATAEFGFGQRINVSSLDPEQRKTVAVIIGIIVAADLIGLLGYAYFRVRLARLQISGLRFADAVFHSSLPFWRLFLFGLLAVLLIVAAFAAITILTGSGAIRDGSLQPAFYENAFLFAVSVFILFVLVMPFIWTLLFKFEVIRQTVLTTAIRNPHALESAAQSAAQGPRTGEGLADALDIGGF